MTIYTLLQNPYFLIVLAIWELTWKGFALWKSAQLKEKYWYIAILVFNTVGILPIIYLVYKYLKEKKFKK